MNYPTSKSQLMEITIDEKLDAARYKCSIFHFCTSYYKGIYDEFADYERSIAAGSPSFGFLRVDGDCILGTVYKFRTKKSLKQFIEENPKFVEHRETTLKKQLFKSKISYV